jgi:hypothetical protein
MIGRMRGLVLTIALIPVALWLAAACSDDRQRPGGVDPCAGDSGDCFTVGQTGEGSGDGSSSGDDGGTVAVEAGAETTINGIVLEYTDDRFLDAVSYAGEAEVFADAPDGDTVSAVYDGINDFALEGVLATERGWIGVRPSDPASDLLPTLHPLDATAGAAVQLPMARASDIDLVLQVGTSPLQRDENTAQLVLRFVDETGLGLPGIALETSDPSQPILFLDGGSWSDTEIETLPDGLALIPNLPAFEMPGGTVPVTFSDGVDSFVLQPRLAQGAVTVMTVLVAP